MAVERGNARWEVSNIACYPCGCSWREEAVRMARLRNRVLSSLNKFSRYVEWGGMYSLEGGWLQSLTMFCWCFSSVQLYVKLLSLIWSGLCCGGIINALRSILRLSEDLRTKTNGAVRISTYIPPHVLASNGRRNLWLINSTLRGTIEFMAHLTPLAIASYRALLSLVQPEIIGVSLSEPHTSESAVVLDLERTDGVRTNRLGTRPCTWSHIAIAS